MNTKFRLVFIYVIICALFPAEIIASITGLKALSEGLSTISVPECRNSNQEDAEKIPVDIYVPSGKEFKGDILLLPGWNFSRKEWQNQSEIIKIAGIKNFRLAFPEMKTTLYESQYFPETKRKWARTPGGQWIKEILLPALQNRGLFLKGGRNFLLGLSTGARGVAIISLANPGIFKAGAALSGDYDQTAMLKDRLMTSVYGPYDVFAGRWEEVDNPQKQAGAWVMPVYLGHGKKDNVVPFSQTLNFYNALKAAHPGLKIVLNAPDNAGHNFKYWASEIGPVFDFFLSAQ